MHSPNWFKDAISQTSNSHTTIVDGARIHFRTWGSPDKPKLLFVHGHAAHSHWWDFIAPAFSNDYSVAAMDMSGNGDSDHRSQYTSVGFANEILSVAKQLGENTFIVGHSFGGMMTRIAGHLGGEYLAGIILVDSVISTKKSNNTPPPAPRTKIRYYPDIASAVRRFRLKPLQACDNQYLIEHIARHSLQQTSEGYRFKLDRAIFAKMIEDPSVDLPPADTMLRSLKCPSGFIYGEQSVFFPAESADFLDTLFGAERVAKIPNARHHVFLDQPQAFITALRNLLQEMSSPG